MKNLSWIIKLALPAHLDFIGDILDDLMEIALELADGFSKDDEDLIADKVSSILGHKGLDPADAKSLGSAAGILCRLIATSKFRRKRKLII
jgi:hypothetical protein